MRLHFPAAFEGAAQGEFVGKFESAAGGQAVGDAGDFEIRTRKALGEVVTGGIAFDVGAEGDDDFVNGFAREALFQTGDAEVFGFNTVERRNFSAEDVKFSAKGTSFLNAQDVHGAFDDADERGVAARVGAESAGGLLSERAADFAKFNLRAGTEDGVGEIFDDGGIGLDQMQGDALGGTRTDAGQFAQGGGERIDGIGEGHYGN